MARNIAKHILCLQYHSTFVIHLCCSKSNACHDTENKNLCMTLLSIVNLRGISSSVPEKLVEKYYLRNLFPKLKKKE